MPTDTLMRHSISTSTKNNAARLAHNSIQGHYHSEYGVMYSADSSLLRWSMTVGCFLDPTSHAAKYASSLVLRRPILGCGMLIGGKESFLVISDMHIPYHHKDTFDFLLALDAEYNFDNILCVGDMVDNHRGSYHESEPGSYDEETEYTMAQEALQELQELFPKMVIVTGNHDEIPVRKLKTCGLPSSMLSDYNSIYGLNKGWTWLPEYRFNSKGAKPVLQPMQMGRNHRWDGQIVCL